jgi:flagellar operon protein
MSDTFKIGQLYPMQVHPGTFEKAKQTATGGNQEQVSFKEVLDKQLLKFSHHAEIRMAQRGIELPTERIDELNEAINTAASKGAKDSLIVLGDIAMIVNVPSRTVVTTMDGQQMASNVFTKIDSAIIIK